LEEKQPPYPPCITDNYVCSICFPALLDGPDNKRDYLEAASVNKYVKSILLQKQQELTTLKIENKLLKLELKYRPEG